MCVSRARSSSLEFSRPPGQILARFITKQHSIKGGNMSEPYLGEIRLFSFNFAPRGWAFCQGQTLPINQNQALFALLGTTYGGNGQTTFSLPNLAGRAAISSGQGLGLSPHNLGESAGSP